MKHVHVDYPTYLELGLQDGHVATVNGKEFNNEGIENVIGYVCKDVDVDTEDVFNEVRHLDRSNGAVTLKLYNGAVKAI